MTKYLSRKESRSTAGRYVKIHSRDWGFSEDAAGAARLAAGLPEAFTRGSAAHVGRVLLATAGLTLAALELFPKAGGVTAGAGEAAAMKLESMTAGMTDDDVRRTLLLLAEAAKTMKNPLDPKLNHQWALWQFGYEGHPLNRETAQKLGIIRRFEKVSGDMAALMHKAFVAAVGHGPALAAWQARLPLLICDLTRPLHGELVRQMLPAAKNELIIVSREIPTAVRHRFYGSDALFAEDRAGILTGLFAGQGNALLMERRMEGWTVTFPVGVMEKSALTDRAIPAHWRVFARCTEGTKDAA